MIDQCKHPSTHHPIEDLTIFITSESAFVTFSSQFPLSIGNHCSHTYHHRLLSFVLEFHLNGIIQYVVFGGWLISLNMFFFFFFNMFFDIHPVVVFISSSFFFIVE